jgi:hypothetical protein
MWVLDLLKEKFPTSRIMTYGFDTKLDGNTSSSGLDDLAHVFLENLIDLGKHHYSPGCTKKGMVLRNPPLIFIGHSLGGLVVKQVRTFLSPGKLSPVK